MAAAQHLFETTAELQQGGFPFDGNIDFWELEADLGLVEQKYIVDGLMGETTFAALLLAIGDDSYPSPLWEELRDRTRTPVSKLTALYHLPEANVKYTSAGLLVSRTENAVPASDNRAKDLKLNLQHKSQDLLDQLVRFLEKNTAIFTDWAASETRANTSLFLPDAKIFSEHYDISENHWIYRKLRSLIVRVEDKHLTRLLGATYLTELRTELKAGTLSEANEPVVKLILPFLANMTMIGAFPRLSINISPRGIILFSNERGNLDEAFIPADQNRLNQVGEKLMTEALAAKSEISNFLDTNASDVLYTAYKAGSAYTDPDIDINDFGNDPDDDERIGYYAG